jgi:arylsulfatase A-like enzyme
MDVFPTLLELALEQKVEGVDGESYAKVLHGEKSWENRTVYWMSRKARPHSTGDSKMIVVRSGDFKLIQYLETKEIELYNLKVDISEENNLAQNEPQKAKQLLAMLKDWKKEMLVPERLNVGKKNKDAKKSKKQD